MPLTIVELLLALAAALGAGAEIFRIRKYVAKDEWRSFNSRLKQAHTASIFLPFGWLLLFIAFQRTSQLLPLLVVAILYYFLVTAPVSRILSEHKIQEVLHLSSFKNLMVVNKLVEKTWELSGYRCRNELSWDKQDDDSISATWSRKPGQTVVSCAFYEDNAHSQPNTRYEKASPSGLLDSPDAHIALTMEVVMAMSYTHERPCLRKEELHRQVREYFYSELSG